MRRILLDDPYAPSDGPGMQFRLTYEGRLLGASRDNTRADHKHDIRMKLHPQIKRQWDVHLWLDQLRSLRYPDYSMAISGQTIMNPAWAHHPTYFEHMERNHQHHDRNWIPLVTDDMGLTCAVDILFLRPGARGGLLNVGDIDGRLKTLFDALAIPRSASGLPPHDPATGPVYVLLNDDRHISHVAVETDELLEPTGPDAGRNDARVIITVNIKPIRSNFLCVGFSSL
jgi:hypothetical protein